MIEPDPCLFSIRVESCTTLSGLFLLIFPRVSHSLNPGLRCPTLSAFTDSSATSGVQQQMWYTIILGMGQILTRGTLCLCNQLLRRATPEASRGERLIIRMREAPPFEEAHVARAGRVFFGPERP